MLTASELRAMRVSESLDTCGNACHMSYVVLAEMRSGGSLICDLLFHRKAGVPIEYLNPNYRKDLCSRLKIPNDVCYLDEYVRAIQNLRTSSNGYFGIHCLFRDLSEMGSPEVAVNFLSRFDRVVILTRKGRLAQAISVMRAQQTGRWESGLAASKFGLERFDTLAISAQVYHALQRNRLVHALLAKVDRPKLFLDYESILDSLESVWSDVQRFVELEPVPASDLGSAMRRQADSQSEEFACRYLDFILGRHSVNE